MKQRAEHVAIWMGEDWAFGQAMGAAAETAVTAGVRFLTLSSSMAGGASGAGLGAHGDEAACLHALQALLDRARDLSVRVLCPNASAGLPPTVAQACQTLEQQTCQASGMTLTLLLGYSGRGDLLRVCRELATEVREGKRLAESITPGLVKTRLLTAPLPPVDLLLYAKSNTPFPSARRLEDALVFEAAYAELCFVDCAWPDLAPADLLAALADFGRRERRFGKTSAQVQVPGPVPGQGQVPVQVEVQVSAPAAAPVPSFGALP